jgi:hypothetical protein
VITGRETFSLLAITAWEEKPAAATAPSALLHHVNSARISALSTGNFVIVSTLAHFRGLIRRVVQAARYGFCNDVRRALLTLLMCCCRIW